MAPCRALSARPASVPYAMIKSVEQPAVGEAGLGDYARQQIERARHDPRLQHKESAAIADFWDAVEEAERVRMLGILGIDELTHTLERHERELGVRHDAADLDSNIRGTLQAMWARVESARIEIKHGHPHINAQALLSLVSALDAMVEDFARGWRGFRVRPVVDQVMSKVKEQVPEAVEALQPAVMAALVEVVTDKVALRALGRAERLRGSGPDRWERVLAEVGLAAPDDRPLPRGLVTALTEVSALRDVLMHRAGRVDLRAMREAPSLPYERGQLVRVSREAYRRYSSAVRCYAGEICFRGIRTSPEVSEERDGPDLERWDKYYLVGT